jgi:hypothetical protein
MTRRLGGAWLPIFHVEKGIPYHVENSIHGLNLAATGGYDAWDGDWQVTMPDDTCPYCKRGRCVGHPINTHWRRPLLLDGFTDPDGQIGLRHSVDRMTLDQAARLITRDGYKMHDAVRMFHAAMTRQLKVAAEVKHPRYAEVPVMERLWAAKEATGARVRVMKLSDGPKPLGTLKAAKAVGAETIMIARGPIPDEWRPWIDYQRGPARFWR